MADDNKHTDDSRRSNSNSKRSTHGAGGSSQQQTNSLRHHYTLGGMHQCLHHRISGAAGAAGGSGSASGSKTIMLVQGEDAPIDAEAIAAAAAKAASTDRIRTLYGHVNEDDFPLPRAWSSQDKCASIGLTQNNLRAHYKGIGKNHNDAASVRTAHPIPAACGLYYFEVTIISKGRDGYMGIGLTAQHFKLNRLPGWDKQSFGYHGDDGNSFCSSGNGQPYGPTFTTGDVIGCGVNLVNNTCFYTKNGHHLGTAFKELPNKLYPTVGLQTPGEVVDANFGQEEFRFDITDMVKELRRITQASIYDNPLPDGHGDWTATMHKLVSSYLVHHGYTATAESFARATNTPLNEDIASIRNRQKIIKMVMSGRMGKAIEHTMKSYPTVLESNLNLLFTLKCRQFVEMVNGSDFKAMTSSIRAGTNTKSTTATTAADNIAASNQTSVIQSTKAYTNGNSTTTTSSGSGNSSHTANAAQPLQHSSTGALHNNSSSSTLAAATALSATSTVASNNTIIAVADDDDDEDEDDDDDDQDADDANNDHVDDEDDDQEVADNEHNNGTENAAKRRKAIGGSTAAVIKTAHNRKSSPAAAALEYTGGCSDVEMENNGHILNGNNHINGTTSLDATTTEDMDVDPVPCKKSSKSGVERMLEFGRELFQLSQRLETEQGSNEANQKMLEDAFSLLAYSNPWSSPLGWQLCPSRRESVCAALNSAILESLDYSWRAPLENCIAHSAELLNLMACSSIGSCAFASIDDYLHPGTNAAATTTTTTTH